MIVPFHIPVVMRKAAEEKCNHAELRPTPENVTGKSENRKWFLFNGAWMREWRRGQGRGKVKRWGKKWREQGLKREWRIGEIRHNMIRINNITHGGPWLPTLHHARPYSGQPDVILINNLHFLLTHAPAITCQKYWLLSTNARSKILTSKSRLGRLYVDSVQPT